MVEIITDDNRTYTTICEHCGTELRFSKNDIKKDYMPYIICPNCKKQSRLTEDDCKDIKEYEV